MIGNVNTSRNFRKTTRYVHRGQAQQVYANFGAAANNDVDQIVQVMSATAKQSDRVQKPCYHISLSPGPEDQLSQGDWYHFAEDFLEAMDLADRQAVGWLHQDEHFPDGRPRPHLHLVINRVGGFGQTAPTSWDYRKVDAALRHLETSYQLDSVAPATEVEAKRDTPGQVHRIAAEQADYENPDSPRLQPPEPSIRTQLQNALNEAIAESTSLEGIADVLSQQGIETRISQRGWSFEKDGIHFAGSQLGRRYSMNSVGQMVDQLEQPDKEQQRQGRQQQRRLTMQQIMQASSEAQEESRQRQYSARTLSHQGQGMMRDSEDVDGLTIIGGAIAATGLAIELGEEFAQRLDQARAKAEGERATEQINKLEEIGDRTTALENSLVEQAQSAQSRLDSQSEVESLEAIASPDTTDSPVTQSLDLANERLSAIGDRLGVDLGEAEPIELDPTAPTGQQLDQMDEAIAQLDERLGTLEEAVAEITQTSESTLTSGSDIAQSLEQFTRARTEFRGETEPSAFASSAGIVALTQEGFQGQDTRLTITDANYGTVFEAAKPADGSWESQINELQPEQAKTITQLPQSVEAYSQYKQGQQILSALQALTPQEFESDRGQINWSSPESGFSYRFDIERQADGTQQVTGRDANGDQVFSAAASGDNGIFVHQNRIPTQHGDELFNQREQALTPERERSPESNAQDIILGVQPRSSRQRELEL